MLTQRSLKTVLRRPRSGSRDLPSSVALPAATSSPAPQGAVTMTATTHRSVGQTGVVSPIGRLSGGKPAPGVFGSLKKPRRR